MERILKVDFHLHSCDSAMERLDYDAFRLLEEARGHEFEVVSITNHDVVTFNEELERFALSLGLLLIPGIELTLDGFHVLVIGADREIAGLRTLDELARVKNDRMLVIAPHPFFPGKSSLGKHLLRRLDLFDAVEFSHCYHRFLDFNRPAVTLARDFGLPMVGSSDAHALWQLGSTFTLVAGEQNLESVFSSIRSGDIEIVSRPLTVARGLRTLSLISRVKLSRLWSRLHNKVLPGKIKGGGDHAGQSRSPSCGCRSIIR